MVGCLSLAVELARESYPDKMTLRREVEGKMNYLVSARPTAVNIKLAAEDLIRHVNELSNNENLQVDKMVQR